MEKVLSVKDIVYLLISVSLAPKSSLISYLQYILLRYTVVTRHPRLTQFNLMKSVPFLVIEIVFVNTETVAI